VIVTVFIKNGLTSSNTVVSLGKFYMKEESLGSMDTQKELIVHKESKIKKYQRLFVGSFGYYDLVKYEIISLMASWVPGAMGLFLRSKLYPTILKKCGKNVMFGSGVVFRHPKKISIGDNVVIDDNCVLDAKGEENDGIFIGKNVFIGRNTILYCQNGDIYIDDDSNIGSNCQIFSAKDVMIGQKVLVGAYSYFIGGGHKSDRVDIPIIDQGREAKGITVKDDVWVGAGVKVLDGINLNKSSIIGTGAVVTQDVPMYAVVAGIPAKIIKYRKKD
jgi:acetyltransferase-like isoleucine patch superfamily enzyme